MGAAFGDDHLQKFRKAGRAQLSSHEHQNLAEERGHRSLELLRHAGRNGQIASGHVLNKRRQE